MTSHGRKPLADPAARFLMVGVLVLIAGFIADARDTPAPAQAWEPRVQNLLAAQEARTGRAPQPPEAAAIREVVLDTEALVQEARALGLDRDDHIVRRRLAQKRRALLQRSPPPANTSAQVSPSAEPITRVSFRHIFFTRHTDEDATTARIATTETALAAGADPATFGDPFIRGNAFSDQPLATVSRIFGPAFTKALAPLDTGVWSQVASTYGTHLVHLDARTTSQPPPQPARDARVQADESGRQAARALVETLRAERSIMREPRPQETP